MGNEVCVCVWGGGGVGGGLRRVSVGSVGSVAFSCGSPSLTG